jgi:hypothetical protein
MISHQHQPHILGSAYYYSEAWALTEYFTNLDPNDEAAFDNLLEKFRKRLEQIDRQSLASIRDAKSVDAQARRQEKLKAEYCLFATTLHRLYNPNSINCEDLPFFTRDVEQKQQTQSSTNWLSNFLSNIPPPQLASVPSITRQEQRAAINAMHAEIRDANQLKQEIASNKKSIYRYGLLALATAVALIFIPYVGLGLLCLSAYKLYGKIKEAAQNTEKLSLNYTDTTCIKEKTPLKRYPTDTKNIADLLAQPNKMTTLDAILQNVHNPQNQLHDNDKHERVLEIARYQRLFNKRQAIITEGRKALQQVATPQRR